MKRSVLFSACFITLVGTALAHDPKGKLKALKTVPYCDKKPNDKVVPKTGGCENEFYICQDGQDMVMQCNVGQAYNEKAKGCALIGAVGLTNCDCTAFYTGDMVTACEVCQAKQKKGKYPLKKDILANAYAQCHKSGAYLRTCEAGEVFCRHTHRCEVDCPPKYVRRLKL